MALEKGMGSDRLCRVQGNSCWGLSCWEEGSSGRLAEVADGETCSKSSEEPELLREAAVGANPPPEFASTLCTSTSSAENEATEEAPAPTAKKFDLGWAEGEENEAEELRWARPRDFRGAEAEDREKDRRLREERIPSFAGSAPAPAPPAADDEEEEEEGEEGMRLPEGEKNDIAAEEKKKKYKEGKKEGGGKRRD